MWFTFCFLAAALLYLKNTLKSDPTEDEHLLSTGRKLHFLSSFNSLLIIYFCMCTISPLLHKVKRKPQQERENWNKDLKKQQLFQQRVLTFISGERTINCWIVVGGSDITHQHQMGVRKKKKRTPWGSYWKSQHRSTINWVCVFLEYPTSNIYSRRQKTSF